MNDDRYQLLDGPPPIDEYLHLRAASGLSARTRAEAEAGLHGAWCACHVVERSTGAAVAMGRVLSDGGWYFHVCDMATMPDHQRQGLGRAVLQWLLDRIDEGAPGEPLVNLLADEPGRPLYRRLGFEDSAPDTIGMSLRGRH